MRENHWKLIINSWKINENQWNLCQKLRENQLFLIINSIKINENDPKIEWNSGENDPICDQNGPHFE